MTDPAAIDSTPQDAAKPAGGKRKGGRLGRGLQSLMGTPAATPAAANAPPSETAARPAAVG